MIKKHKGFIIVYLVWALLNLVFLILAITNVFGVSDATMTEFWPFTVVSPRYYDFYEFLVYLGMPLLIYLVYRAGQSLKFWISYIIWSIMNISLMAMALSDVFGISDRTVKKFWPFSVGGLKDYDLLELVVYLAIPLIIYFVYRLVHNHMQSAEEEVP